MVLTADDVHDLAELLLEKRLGEHTSSLACCRDELDRELDETRQPTGAMARGRLVTACITAYERHCEQVLTDLVGLMRSYRAAQAAARIRPMLEHHLQVAADEIVHSLTESRYGGMSSTPAERNRIANATAGIRLAIDRRWDEEIELLDRLAQHARLDPTSPEDLDDRLPLARRRVFDQDIEALATSACVREPLALLMIDIDHFKRVNDGYGHPVGDEVLLEVAARMAARVAHKGRCYRYGGEELAVLLPTYSTEEAVGLAERLRRDLEATPISGHDLLITASIGVACIPDTASEAGDLLRQADQALYAAKEGGRNQVRAATLPGTDPGAPSGR